MAAGQQALSVAADVAALDALADELSGLELLRGAARVRQLRVLLRLEAVGRAAGMDLATVAHAALALGCSEHRASRLLAEAVGLGELPGGLEAVECGLLTVEQSSTLVEQLAPLPFDVRLQVWRRLQDRLTGRSAALPPARLSELLRRWVVEADPADAVDRRRQAEAGRRVDYRRRADGLGDLFACGFTGPDLQAVLSRLRDRSAPVGPDDDRTADQRRFDALKDLLLGRDPLPLTDPHDLLDGCRCASAGGGRAACGCWPGSPVPCGAELLVHLSIDTALGTSDEPAELVGHGAVDPDLVAQLLLAAPRLRPVWTDERGVPVAVGDAVTVPARDDPRAVRDALLTLALLPAPDLRHPRHPLDHPPDPPPESPSFDSRVNVPTHGAHPAGEPGSYRLPRRLRRLLDTRSPRCEWPGCGARASRCDAEHDLAWPAGPTCACNLGPCCRRHHRIKQLGWTKTRHQGGVTWTSPGGASSWLSPNQHAPAARATRPLAPLPDPAEHDELLAEEDVDPAGLDLRASDTDVVVEHDVLGEHLATGDTRWTLDLDDPHLWHEPLYA